MQHHHARVRLVVSIFCLISTLTGIDALAAQSHGPLAPTVDPLPSITSADEVTLKGRTDPNLRVIVEGGANTVGVDADEKGRFSVRVMLKHDRMNTLEVYSQADRRNAPNSDPTRVSIRQDDQPPRITATLDPQPNEKGWNNGSVTVRFACTDAHGIARCPDPITVATAGEDQTIRAAAIDSAGNSETIKVRVNIDSTQPTAKITLSPAPNANGWYRSSVSVKFTCSDERNGSGIAQCPRPIDVKNAGRDVPVSGTVVDNAGNRTVVSATVNLDRTDPTITMDESHEVTLIYSSPIHLSGHISDDLSGVAAVNCGSSPASVTNIAFGCDVAVKAGKHRIKVWATDNAGNVATVHARVVLASPLPGGDAHKVMVSADVNGDGRIDVVHTNFSAREVSILLGNGDGTFQAERRVPVGEYASSVALADVNRDGVLDLVTTHYATAEVAIQYGQADGTYVAGPHIAVDDFPTAAVIADVNDDGLPDIVTAHMHNAKVQVHLAQIDGSFVSQPASTVGNGPVALAIGDVNGDGRLDIVSANFLSSDVSILPGLGVGKFGPEQRVVLSTGSGPTAILIADLNADGIADLATADFNANTVSIALRKSDGSYEGVQSMAVGQHPIALAAFDVTRDGLLDLITANLVSGDLSVLPGGAAGVFSTAQRWANAVVPAPLFVPRPILFRELVQLPASTATSDLNMPDPLAAAARPACGRIACTRRSRGPHIRTGHRQLLGLVRPQRRAVSAADNQQTRRYELDSSRREPLELHRPRCVSDLYRIFGDSRPHAGSRIQHSCRRYRFSLVAAGRNSVPGRFSERHLSQRVCAVRSGSRARRTSARRPRHLRSMERAGRIQLVLEPGAYRRR